MVISGDNQHAAMRRRAIGIAVFQRVAGTVNTRAFAVPQAKYTIDLFVRMCFHLLRSKDSRGSQFFIHCRKKLNVVLFEQIGHTP